MKVLFYSILLFCISLFLQSCADKIVSGDDPPPSGMTAKLSDIQQNVFSVSCATAGCHVGQFPQGGLNLSAGASFANLVNVDSNENPSLKRVEPGNSSQSFLIRKLEGSGTSVMPPAGKLSGVLIDSIKSWIDKGALNN